MIVVSFFLLLLYCVSVFGAPNTTCSITINGKLMDFTPLSNKMYSSTGTWNNTKYNFEVQVCGTVVSSFKNCSSISPVNQIDGSGRCVRIGDIATTTWDPNPYEDGAYLTYYHGDKIDNVIHRSARIYFICDTKQGVPGFEHVTPCGQYHFSFSTPLAC